jgi:hypothetical protein
MLAGGEQRHALARAPVEAAAHIGAADARLAGSRERQASVAEVLDHPGDAIGDCSLDFFIGPGTNAEPLMRKC